ncbi:uncharacterized protein PFLUO_LOCUS1725 [Penicillium psychrofluorescens]|uniref:uncharacterized protein n=1 Tax=Penicillium psychrofluorescens TaxID=3158075 RepID=UPI003CCE1419
MGLLKLAFICVLASVIAAAAAAEDVTVYVDPFIGTEGPTGNGANSGDTFPGVSVPFGMVKIGPDTNEADQASNPFAGYTPDGNVTAFTCFHECGVGGGSKYGVVGHMPLTTLDGVNVLDNTTYMQPRVGHDRASVGYYASQLANGANVELSASQHAGFFQYNYPSHGDRIVLADVSHNLPSGIDAEFPKSQTYSNGQMIVQNGGQRFVGWGVWRGGWGGGGVAYGEGSDMQVYFCNDFDSIPSSFEYFTGPWNDPTSPPSPDTQVTLGGQYGVQGGPVGDDQGNRVGAYFIFPNHVDTVKSKLGVSFISIDKACKFQEEIPSWTLNDTVEATKEQWNKEVFDKMSINDKADKANNTRLTMFYSALYRMHQMPSDRTGENPKWSSSEPYYDDFYTLWDTFRCLNSWYLLAHTQRALDMLRSLVDTWRHEGYMPDARSGNYNGKVQGGTNADIVLADAWVKGFNSSRYGINWSDAYAAMQKDAEVTPKPNHDPDDPTCANKEGRCALPDWLEYSYITPNFSLSVSRTVDYSLNDFAISQVAKDMAPQDYEKYFKRSA